MFKNLNPESQSKNGKAINKELATVTQKNEALKKALSSK